VSSTNYPPMTPNFSPHRGGRSSQYRTYLKTLRNRLQYVEEKELEWCKQHPGDRPASYFKTERDTLKWVLELVSCFILDERRPPGSPIPVIADECPACRTTMSRHYDGLKRQDPWRCRTCGHQYPVPPEDTTSAMPEPQNPQ
jgi:hypothetical protein